MTPGMRKGLIVALIHVLMVASLGAKLMVDRATRPRVWARTLPVDPDLPIRGRYVRLRIEAHALGLPAEAQYFPVTLEVRDQKLTAFPAAHDSALRATVTGPGTATLDRAIAYFIPEHIPDPSIRATGEELWVEVTLPRRGSPRPIRLGVMKDGDLRPLSQ